MEVGTKIKKIRELKNFSQEYMARQMHVSQATYSRFEKEGAEISITQLDQIARILDVKLEELINFNEKCIFNNYAPHNHNQGYVINNIASAEKEFYEKQLLALQKENDYLKQLLTKLSERREV